MTVKLEENIRAEVEKTLPEIIKRVLDSYNDFVLCENEEGENQTGKKDKKVFSEHHAAGKSALAHLDLLFKLAKSLGVDTGNSRAKAMEYDSIATEEVRRFYASRDLDNNENDS